MAMTKNVEKRIANIGLRTLPSLKLALERAAAADHRPVASLIEIVLTEWLRTNGYLETAN